MIEAGCHRNSEPALRPVGKMEWQPKAWQRWPLLSGGAEFAYKIVFQLIRRCWSRSLRWLQGQEQLETSLQEATTTLWEESGTAAAQGSPSCRVCLLGTGAHRARLGLPESVRQRSS